MNKVFILVHVWFDYHRFQSNQYAHTDKTKLYEYAAKNNSNLPVVEYNEPYDDEEILGSEEIEHFWIQTIEF